MSPVEVSIVISVVLVGATLQGSIGFGMGLLASPILILLDPQFVPAPILMTTAVLTLLLAARERHAIDVHGVQWAMVGRLGGTVVAVAILLVMPADRLVLLCGVFIMAGVTMSLSGRRWRPVRPVLIVAGALSGLLGTVASVGGPPMALVYQDASGPRIRSTMSGFFLIGTLVSLVALWLVGRLGVHEVRLAALMMPSIIAGFALSRWTAGYIDGGYVRPAVLIVAAATGALVVLRQVM